MRARVLFRVLATLTLLTTTFSCSLPNLETPECAEARDSVKRFYSLHFANQQRPTDEYVKAREEFLSEALSGPLSSFDPQKGDYFTRTQDFPKAFRVGTCRAESAESSIIQVLLLWRDDTRNEQNEVKVRTVKAGDRWLIDSVEN
jgi:hypothetical protein